MPTAAAIRKACTVRHTVTAKSLSSGPPARPLTSAPSASSGGGSRMALMKPRRTTRSQTMNSTTGPMKGSALSSAGERWTTAAGALAGGAQGLADATGAAVTEEVPSITLNLCRASSPP